MEENKDKESNTFSNQLISILKERFVQDIIKKYIVNERYKSISDILIALICITSVMLCAKWGFIEKTTVNSLLSLIVGAVIGSRFKAS